MPVENENKYVLSDTFSESSLKDWKALPVKQGYLENGPRLRRYGDELLFTYKRWVDNNSKLVEIETGISQEDFDSLWPDCINLLEKQRYVMQDDDLEWVVDFFKDEQGKTYFVMAEVEMPEHMTAPDDFPAVIKDRIIHHVQKNDDRFSSRQLSDKSHAQNMLAQIVNGTLAPRP